MRIPGLTVKIDDATFPWRPTRHRGISWAPLFAGEGVEGPRESAVLIRMSPGCGYPPHRHVGIEEVLVLAGGYRDELGDHRTGEYLRYAPDSIHAPVALGDPHSPEGPGNEACLLFASARGGVVNIAST